MEWWQKKKISKAKEEKVKGPRGKYEGLDFLQDEKGIFQKGSMTEGAKSLLSKTAVAGTALGAAALAPGVAAGVVGAGAAGYGLYKASPLAIGAGKAVVGAGLGAGKAIIGAGKGIGKALIGAGKSGYQALKDIDMPSKPKKTMAEETGVKTDKTRLEETEDLPPDFIGPPEKTLETSESTGENLLEAASGYKQGKGLTAEANTKLYEADPSMKGKSPEERIKRYEELFGGGETDEEQARLGALTTAGASAY